MKRPRLLATALAIVAMAAACGGSPKPHAGVTTLTTLGPPPTATAPRPTAPPASHPTTTTPTTTTPPAAPTTTPTTTTAPTTTAVPTTTTLPRPVRTLPGGYVPARTGAKQSSVGVLRLAAAHRLDPAALVRAPLTPAEARQWLPYVAATPVRFTVHPLLVSSLSLAPGKAITLAAGDLAPGRTHLGMVVLVGAGFRSQHLVLVGHGVAAAVVTMPAHMTRGTWVLGVEDLSRIRAAGKRHLLTGSGYADLAVFRVR